MILTLFSHLIIPGLTLFLARGTGWFTTNLSSIRTALSRQGEFLLWSLTVGGYFYAALHRLLKLRSRTVNVKKETAMFFLAAAMMVLFVLTPYLPGQFPLLADIHVVSALLCSMFFFLCLFLLILEAYRRTPGRYRFCLLWLWWAAVFCICAFLLTGIINTAMEICFVLVCTFLCRHLIMLEEKNGSPDPGMGALRGKPTHSKRTYRLLAIRPFCTPLPAATDRSCTLPNLHRSPQSKPHPLPASRKGQRF